jgi:hypothetical protein
VKSTHLLVGSALVLVAACGSDNVTSVETIGAAGSLSFSFTGGSGPGTFNANGAVPVNVTVNFGSASWAAAALDNTNQTIEISAAVPRTSSTWDVAGIHLAGQGTGTRTIGANCTGNACNDVSITFGATQGGANFQFVCTLTSGTVVVSAISTTRVSGTISGTGSCFSSTGTTSAFAMTNGTFDVGLVSTTLP